MVARERERASLRQSVTGIRSVRARDEEMMQNCLDVYRLRRLFIYLMSVCVIGSRLIFKTSFDRLEQLPIKIDRLMPYFPSAVATTKTTAACQFNHNCMKNG